MDKRPCLFVTPSGGQVVLLHRLRPTVYLVHVNPDSLATQDDWITISSMARPVEAPRGGRSHSRYVIRGSDALLRRLAGDLARGVFPQAAGPLQSCAARGSDGHGLSVLPQHRGEGGARRNSAHVSRFSSHTSF